MRDVDKGDRSPDQHVQLDHSSARGSCQLASSCTEQLLFCCCPPTHLSTQQAHRGSASFGIWGVKLEVEAQQQDEDQMRAEALEYHSTPGGLSAAAPDQSFLTHLAARLGLGASSNELGVYQPSNIGSHCTGLLLHASPWGRTALAGC